MKVGLAGQPMERIPNYRIVDSKALRRFLWRSVRTGKVGRLVASQTASFQKWMKAVALRE